MRGFRISLWIKNKFLKYSKISNYFEVAIPTPTESLKSLNCVQHIWHSFF